MKTCSYCGKENQELATTCFECGSESFKSDATTSPTSQPANRSSLDSQVRGILADPIKLFRALIIVGNAAYLISVILPYFESRFASPETLYLLEQTGRTALINVPTNIYWLSVLIYFAIAVGLYQFSAAARTVFAISYIFWGLLILFTGVAMISPLVGFFALVTTLADGAIFLLAFATPLKRRFV